MTGKKGGVKKMKRNDGEEGKISNERQRRDVGRLYKEKRDIVKR